MLLNFSKAPSSQTFHLKLLLSRSYIQTDMAKLIDTFLQLLHCAKNWKKNSASDSILKRRTEISLASPNPVFSWSGIILCYKVHIIADKRKYIQWPMLCSALSHIWLLYGVLFPAWPISAGPTLWWVFIRLSKRYSSLRSFGWFPSSTV